MTTTCATLPRRAAKGLLLGVAFVVMAIGGYLGILQLTDNFAPVIAGELYRSGQFDGAELEAYAKAHGIRSVINLQGEHRGSAWYDEEMAASQKLGLAHFDFPMTARKELTQARAAELISLMEKAPKPLLIHCKAGADRSGLAAALYLAAIAKKGERAAEGQISLYYGHISLPLSSTYAMDRAFEALEPWLGIHDS